MGTRILRPFNRVSVIIPAYRAASTIGRAIDSVLRQTVRANEVIIVDDGSPDDLSTALACYGDHVIVIRKQNGGVADARNVGIDRATGEAIAFLDADDYWEPQKLETQLDIFSRHPEVGVVAGRHFEQSCGQARRHAPSSKFVSYDRILRLRGEAAFGAATAVWTGTVIVRREVLGEERFVHGLDTAEDRDLWVRLILAAPLYLSSEPLATAVLEPNSLSRSNVDRDCSNMLRIVRRHGSLLGRRGLKKWEAYVYRRWAAGHLGQNSPRSAVQPARRRLAREPFSAEAWWIAAKSQALSFVCQSNSLLKHTGEPNASR